MAFTRQILLFWLLAGLFLATAAFFFIRPRLQQELRASEWLPPTIDCSWGFSGRAYGILQLDKGANLPSARARLGMLPVPVIEALFFRREAKGGYYLWEHRRKGAARTVAAVFVANKGYMLPMRIDGFLLACGLLVMGVTVGLSVEMKRRMRMGLEAKMDEGGMPL